MRQKLTLWQRAILAIMYATEQECLSGSNTAVSHKFVQFERKSLEFLLDFDWQGCHTARMAELEKMGWITIRLHRGRVCGYRLTTTAMTRLWENHALAMPYTADMVAGQSKIPF